MNVMDVSLMFSGIRPRLSVKFLKFLPWTVIAVLAFSLSALADDEKTGVLQEGDIVFSSSPQGQGRAIMDATNSPYTHCGIVVIHDGMLMVLEAVEPVGITSVKNFKSLSMPGTFAAKRLKAPIPAEAYQTARAWGKKQVGLHYDSQFRWSDERMYCSELVWKIYEKAGVRLCDPRPFQDYNLSKASVKKVIEERYGNVDAMPKDEKVVAPSDLAKSSLLEEVSIDK